jgi:PAS domain S-box-containing protein
LAEAQRLSHTGSFGWKPDTGEIVWSDETYRIFEHDPTVKLTIASIAQRVHPEDRAEFQRIIDGASDGATHFEHEYRLLLPDGSIRHVHALAHAVPNPSGNREFVGAVTDITAKKRAENKILEQETELRQILDLAPQLISVYGNNRERFYANRVMLDYLGTSLESWRSRTKFGDSLHPHDWERGNGQFDRGVASGTGFELELRLRKGDGSYRWFLTRCNPVCDETGQIMRWFVAATDIEERKQAEEKLRTRISLCAKKSARHRCSKRSSALPRPCER